MHLYFPACVCTMRLCTLLHISAVYSAAIDTQLSCPSSDARSTISTHTHVTWDLHFTILRKSAGYSASVDTKKQVAPPPMPETPLIPCTYMWYAITHFTAHSCWVFCGCECEQISCPSSDSGYTSIPAHLLVTWDYSLYYTYLLGILRPLILEFKCLSSDSGYASIPTHLRVIWHYPCTTQWDYPLYYKYLLGILRPLILNISCPSSDSRSTSISTVSSCLSE